MEPRVPVSATPPGREQLSRLDSGIVIRPAEARDLAAIVLVHGKAFRTAFLTRLGDSFLALYYETVLRHADRDFLVAEAGGTVIGFAAGFRSISDFYRTLNRQWPSIMRSIIVPVCRDPRIIGRLLADYRVSSKRSRMRAADSCELASLAVDPDFDGSGVGRVLLRTFTENGFSAGASSISVTTDAEDNARVNAFYQNAGFRLVRTSVIQGRRMNEFRLSGRVNC